MRPWHIPPGCTSTPPTVPKSAFLPGNRTSTTPRLLHWLKEGYLKRVLVKPWAHVSTINRWASVGAWTLTSDKQPLCAVEAWWISSLISHLWSWEHSSPFTPTPTLLLRLLLLRFRCCSTAHGTTKSARELKMWAQRWEIRRHPLIHLLRSLSLPHSAFLPVWDYFSFPSFVSAYWVFIPPLYNAFLPTELVGLHKHGVAHTSFADNESLLIWE